MNRPDTPSWTAAKADGDAGELAAITVWERLGFEAYLRPGRNTHDLLAQARIEVKSDHMAASSGNFALEVSYRGAPSGIMKTDATIWHVATGLGIFVVRAAKLRELAQSGRFRRTHGGDNGVSELVLIPVTELRRVALIIMPAGAGGGGGR